jgi:hypothetical protein
MLHVHTYITGTANYSDAKPPRAPSICSPLPTTVTPSSVYSLHLNRRQRADAKNYLLCLVNCQSASCLARSQTSSPRRELQPIPPRLLTFTNDDVCSRCVRNPLPLSNSPALLVRQRPFPYSESRAVSAASCPKLFAPLLLERAPRFWFVSHPPPPPPGSGFRLWIGIENQSSQQYLH